MSKVTLSSIPSGYATAAAHNADNTAITAAIENTLSRDGTGPNQMNANLDMNGYAILNQRATSGNDNFIWMGTWTTGTTYAVNNLVYAPEGSNLGNTLICVTANTAGATLDGDAANWAVFAQRGASGVGSGDVVGPASSTADSLARFNGTTGLLLKDGAVIGTDVMAYDAGLAATTAFAKTLLDDSDAGTARSTLKITPIFPITATVAVNTLTLGLNATSIDFRSTTLTTGIPNSRDVPSPISLVVPDTATLGTVSNVASRLVLLAIDNVGTVELAVVNLAGNNNLDETTLISTTAITTGADSASTIYSTTARTNVPFRVVGFVDITEATAGTWATVPTLVQGVGGQALAAMSSLGYGQTWHTTSNTFGITYYNIRGKPILVSIELLPSSGSPYMTATVNGVACMFTQSVFGTITCGGNFIVPAGGSYLVTLTGSATVGFWSELY